MLCISSIAIGQIETRNGYYEYEGKGYSVTELGSILKTNETAYARYNDWLHRDTGKSWLIAGGAMATLGTATIGALSIRKNFPLNNSSAFAMLTVITSPIVFSVGLTKYIRSRNKDRLTNAINVFNLGEGHRLGSISKKGPSIKLAYTNASVGIFVTF